MRDPDRLDDFYGKLKDFHAAYFPDWRFGQLVCNFFSWCATEKRIDVFYIEEYGMIELLKEYVLKISN